MLPKLIFHNILKFHSLRKLNQFSKHIKSRVMERKADGEFLIYYINLVFITLIFSISYKNLIFVTY